MKNTKGNTHIQRAERFEIAILLNRGYSIRGIAKAMGRGKSTIADEIKYNSTNGVYDPIKADKKARRRRMYSKFQGMKIRGDNDLENYVQKNLKEDWSPEEIAGRIREVDKHIKYASRQAIYKYLDTVFGQNFAKYLRKKNKKKSGPKRGKLEKLKDRVFIENRPRIVAKKARFGDFEADFIVSGKNGSGALLVIYERKGLYVKIIKLKTRKAEEVKDAFYKLTGCFVEINSMTLDNDVSFKRHAEISKVLNAPIFFCHPYHSWEKGGVENMNGLIRYYIPKRTDISQVTKKFIQSAEDKLNNRPRKSLNYKTPLEIMNENQQLKNEPFSATINDIISLNKIPQTVRFEG